MRHALRIALMTAAILIFFSQCGHAQPLQQVHGNPDCQIYFSFTSAGTLSGTSPVQDNRQQGCTTWSLVYLNSGFSPVSVTLQSAANNAGAPGSYGTGFPVQQTVVAGSNPASNTTGGYLWIVGTNAWVRVAVTGTGGGTVTGCLFGWRIPNAQ